MDAGLRTAVCVCLVIVLLATISDVASRKIPNVLTLGGIVLGLAIHAGVGYVGAGAGGALRGFAHSLEGVAICGIFPVISFARHEMGGGDVKLFAAVGALSGPVLGLNAEAFTFVVTLAIVLPWRLLRHRALMPSLRNGWTAIANVFRAKEHRVPYVTTVKLPPVIMAPSILAGFCVALLRHGILR
jgi:prepilin peptidase CpaA